MRRRPWLKLVAPVALAASIGGSAAPGCYGATEISVAVTTTVPCSQSLVLTTQIFTGPAGTTDFGTAPAAETIECGAVEPRVGTLSIVPSGARDGQFDLEVVGAVGVPASDCRDASLGRDSGAPVATATSPTTGCVVARRRVSFRPHKALTVPVLLSARCIGVPCGADETCDLGICTSTADCTDQGCPRERGDQPAPVADAAADGGVDAPVDAPTHVDASSPSCDSTAALVIDGQNIQGPLVVQGSDFVYLNVSAVGGVREIRRIPRTAPATETVVISTAAVATGATLASLAATPTDLAWFEQTADAKLFVARGGGAAVGASHGLVNHDKTSLAFSSALMVGFWRVNGGVSTTAAFTFSPAGGTFADPPDPDTVPQDIGKVLVDDTGEFYGVGANTLVRYTVTPVTFQPTRRGIITTLGVLDPDFALVDRTIYVGATPPAGGAGTVGIYGIPRDLIADPYTRGALIPVAPAPHSITSDGVSLFYLVGAALWRADLASATPTPTHLANLPGMPTRLQVADDCVYWIDGDSRIMKRAKQ